MGKCYVKAYYDWIEQTAALSDAERGRLFIAILEYARTGIPPELEGAESILFPVFRTMLDRDDELSAERSRNGAKGGKQTQASTSKIKQTEANANDPKPTKTKKEDKDKEKDLFPPDGGSTRAKRFTPPTLAEVQSYVAERHSAVDPQGFIDFYEAKGWMVGKTPMKDWKAACRNAEKWERWGHALAAPGGKTDGVRDAWMGKYIRGAKP